MIQTAEDKVKEYCQCIHREIEHWKVINQNGCNDPFWSDGCNMNLTRKHIIYYQSKIREACTENQLPLPEECYFPYRRKWTIIIWRILSRNHGLRDYASWEESQPDTLISTTRTR